MTTAHTKLLGVLGWPIEHSRSPAIHTAALRALAIDAEYLPFAVPPERFADAIHGLRALGAVGANVTLPHKERALEFVDEVEPAARAIGAVNTIVRDGDRLIGTNTDAAGLTRSLADDGIDLVGIDALVIGAGGAARASVYGLAAARAKRVVIAARRIEAAAQLADDLRVHCACPLTAVALEDASIRTLAAESRLLVQATSATLNDGPAADPFAAALPIDPLPADATVVDLVYAPRETAVMRRASARGLRTIDGFGMLLGQAALAFERWFGRTAPLAAMRSAITG